MSHFSVLLVTDEYPTEEIISKYMQPFHEYECTGIKDEYVIAVDVTDEAKSIFERNKNNYSSFKEFVVSWYGEINDKFVSFDDKTEKVIKYTNPNNKWDWYQVGGRFTGKLGTYDPKTDPDNFTTCMFCYGTGYCVNENGVNKRVADLNYTCECNGSGKELKWPTKWKKIKNDIIQVKDLNLDSIKLKNIENRFAIIKEICAKHNISLSELEFGLINYKKVKAEWANMEEPRPRGKDFSNLLNDAGKKYYFADTWHELDLINNSLVEWAQSAPSLSSYAINLKGNWIEKGTMGWFGVSINENDDWDIIYSKFLDGLLPDEYLTIIDCHV